MIQIDKVLSVHTKIIAATGGSDGLRDMDILESALARPFQTFDGKDLYPSVIERLLR